MSNKYRVSFTAALAVALSATAAQAASTTTTFQVTANVQATCEISATTLDFGTYSGASDPATSTLNVTCTNGTTYDVGLDAGTSGGTVSTRQMTGPASALLPYGLFSESSHTTNWGNTVGTDTVQGTGNGSAQSLTVFGLVPADEFVSPGVYSDTITATVTF